MFCQQVGDFPVVVNNHNVWLLRSHTELGMDRTTPWHRKGKEHHFKFVMCDVFGGMVVEYYQAHKAGRCISYISPI